MRKSSPLIATNTRFSINSGMKSMAAAFLPGAARAAAALLATIWSHLGVRAAIDPAYGWLTLL